MYHVDQLKPRDILAANNIKHFAFAKHETEQDSSGERGEHPLVDERRKP
jgi:hypothetical protein